VKYHFFANEMFDVSIENLSDLENYLNSCGYVSFLQTYNSNQPDVFLKSARALKKENKIKYMIALRSSALTPEYCAMLVSAFDSIESDRIILNILHGTLEQDENLSGIILKEDAFSSRENLRKHTRKFLQALFQNNLFKNSSVGVVVSGASLETSAMAKEFSCCLAIDLECLMRSTKNEYVGIDQLLVTFDVVIVETEKEKNAYKKVFGKSLSNLFIGNERELLKKIIELKNVGVTDILFSNHPDDKNKNRIHDFVKKHSKTL
jgi:hypothetical protein